MKRAAAQLRRLAGRAAWPFELVFLALVTGSVVPLWLVRYPPIEDLPQHLAAIRVLHSLHDPAFGLAPYFELTLSRTQYLAYYLTADLLAYPLGVRHANLVLVTAAVAGTPLALRALLRALGRDEKLALFALPLRQRGQRRLTRLDRRRGRIASARVTAASAAALSRRATAAPALANRASNSRRSSMQA